MGSQKMKPNFAQTCNRFSQFFKERRALGYFDAFNSIASASPKVEIKGAKEVPGPTDAGMSLFPETIEKKQKSLELFPLMSDPEESTKHMPTYCRELPVSKKEPKNTITPSMTIFYGGRVLVFEEMPEDKAHEIMSLANQGMKNSNSQVPIQTTQIQTQSQTESENSPNNSTITTHLTQNFVPQGASGLPDDLPIARRVSLHRFMEKRKDRVATSAPYQLNNSSMTITHSQSKKYNLMKSLYKQPEQQQLELKL